MTGVADGERGDPVLARPDGRHLRHLGRDHLSEATVTVEHQEPGSVEDDLELGSDVDLPRLHLTGVIGQLPDAVGSVTAQVGVDERRGHPFGVTRARAERADQFGRVAPQAVGAEPRLGHGWATSSRLGASASSWAE